MLKKRSRILIPLLIVAVSIMVFAYMKTTRPITERVKASEKYWSVNAWTVSKQELSPHISLYGVIESPYNTTVSSVINADVRSLQVLEGQKVMKGQPLIALDPADVARLVKQRQADVARVKSSLRSAKKELVRQEALYKKKIISPSAIDKARQNVATLQAEFASVQARLEQIQNDEQRSKVTAPFSGRITSVHVSPGNRVAVGSPLVSLYDSANLEVRTQLPNTILGKLRELWDQGKVVHAKVGAQKTLAVLSRITGEVKANSAGIDALFRLEAEDKSLSLGQSVALTLLLPPEPNVMFLPYEAVYDLDKIYLIVEGRLEQKQIKRLGQYEEKQQSHVLIDAAKLPKGVVMVTQLSNAITGLKVEIANLDGIKQTPISAKEKQIKTNDSP